MKPNWKINPWKSAKTITGNKEKAIQLVNIIKELKYTNDKYKIKKT